MRPSGGPATIGSTTSSSGTGVSAGVVGAIAETTAASSTPRGGNTAGTASVAGAVTAGRERGKTGKVLRVLSDKNRVLIEGLNRVKRHTKPRGVQTPGGIVEKEASIHASNVQPLCGRCNKPARVGRRRLEDGSSVRFCRRCNDVLESA